MLEGRYEFKFPVVGADRTAIVAGGREALREDPHGTQAVYRVASLYFDSPDRLAYREKRDGEYRRRKFRLRWYPSPSVEGVAAAFFEIKHRIDQRVAKERIGLAPEGAVAILEDPQGELPRLEEHALRGERLRAASSIAAVLRQAQLQRLEPVTVISYVREAWMGALDSRLRLTFDSACQAYRPEAWRQAALDQGASILAPERLIMEVKFDRRLARWLRDLVTDRGLLQRRFSKYAAGVEVLRQAR